MSQNLTQLSGNQITARIKAGELTASEVVEHYLKSIEVDNPSLNAFTTLAIDQSRQTAQQIDQRRSNSQPLGPLAGLPIAIKDGICTEGIKTTASSKMLENFVAPYDATVVKRLKQADAIILGKTNMDEFSMGSSTENSYFGPTLNPYHQAHVPGGSSGGSAAAVAAGLAPVALGSDTGGSIRQPAAFCNLTGLKPTYGLVSRFGLIAFASSLDQIGPMARTAEDCALLMSVIGGHDPADSTSSTHRPPDFLSELNRPIKGLKIGICREYFDEGLDQNIADAVHNACQKLVELGAEPVDVSLSMVEYAVPTYYVVAPCEASSNLARYDGVRYTYRAAADHLDQMLCRTRAEGFGPEVQRRIMLGTYALSAGHCDAFYLRASKIRRLIREEYDRAFTQCDVILGPTTPTPPFKLGQHTQNPLAMYLADIYTVSANLAGIPAISIPVGFTPNGLPIGMQLQGRMFADSTLLSIAHQFQQQTTWHQTRPKMQTHRSAL